MINRGRTRFARAGNLETAVGSFGIVFAALRLGRVLCN